MKIKLICLALIFMTCSALLHADRLQDSYNKMLATYAKVNSWQAAITQSNYFAQSQSTLKSSGTFYFQRGKVAIYYTKPQVQYLLVTDGKVTIYDQAARSAMRSGLLSSVQSLNPVEIVKTYWNASQKSLVQSVQGTTAILLKPKSDKQIKEITVTLQNSTGYVKKLSYRDISGNTVSLSFTSGKVNQAIPKKIWNLPIPKSVKVLEY